MRELFIVEKACQIVSVANKSCTNIKPLECFIQFEASNNVILSHLLLYISITNDFTR